MIFKNYLGLANAKELFINDQLGLVKELVKASLINLPFQNMTTMGAFLPRERATPTFRQILNSLTRGEGGLCKHVNNHMKLQLESLGYNVELVSGCFRRSGVPISHCLVKVKIPSYAVKRVNVKPTDLRHDTTYLVDVGCGVPLHEPIDLSKLPYYGRAGGLGYRYEQVDATTIQRIHECGDALQGKKHSTYVSPQDCTIDLATKKFSDFYKQVHDIYSNPRSVYLHQEIYSFRYLEITEDDFQIVCVRGKELMLITKETRHVQKFENYEQLKPSLLKYFPMVSPRDVELSVKHYSIPFEEALTMSSTGRN